MELTTTEKGLIELNRVYNPILLKSDGHEDFIICMRDSGFEFNYNDVWYSAKCGKIILMETSND